MKKLMISLVALLLALTSYAQTGHLKFMGIPLNGSIASFQAKLQAKGVRYDAEGSRHLPVGTRAFKGTFSGEKADIYVYYNEKTKVVYRAKAVMTCANKSIGEQKYNSFKSMLKEKYGYGGVAVGEQDGHPNLLIRLADDEGMSLGDVGMYMSSPYSYMDEVSLHIDYEDATNSRANQNQNMDDL